MREKVLKYIREHGLMRPGDRVGAAVSGGADSVALLRVLLDLKSELGIVLSVIHFNHMIRGAEAKSDEEFTGALAQKYELQFFCSQADVPQHAQGHGVSLESAGRELRYGYFRSLLEAGEVDKVATAHTTDDQAETVLMRALRGATPRSLRAMGARDGMIARPLLRAWRADIEAYCSERGLNPLDDPSNRDRRFLRARVRHEVMPVLEEVFPGARRRLCALADGQRRADR